MKISETHPVITLINDRKVKGTLPNNRGENDNFKLGLVIEGGGMRGVVATAMASALHFLGLVNVFDAVYGSSAGSLTGTFFITNRMPFGPSIYYENINNKNFINFNRGLFGKNPIMNLDFLIWNVLENIKPMDWKGVLNSDIPLHIIVSSLNKGKSVNYISNEIKSKDDLFTLLKASANIPVIAGPPVKYKDDLLFDASLYESIPYKTAISDGCTHVLCLLTRPKGLKRNPPSLIQNLLIIPKLKKIMPGLEEVYIKSNMQYNNDLGFLNDMNNDYSNNSTSIFSISPSSLDASVSRMEIDKHKLIQGSISGMKAVYKVFSEVENLEFGLIIQPYFKDNDKIII